MNWPILLRTSVAILISLFGPASAALGQTGSIESLDRERTKVMLRNIVSDVKKNYYDPTLKGVDFEQRIAEADEKIANAKNLGQALAAVAWTLDALDDSHTYFIPPLRTFRTDYGWRIDMVGEKCLVREVRAGSDAEARGLRPGDEILAVNGLAPRREIFDKLLYLFYVLRPQPALRLNVRRLDGSERELEIAAKVRQQSKTVEINSFTLGDFIREGEASDARDHPQCLEQDEVNICRLPSFDLARDQVRELASMARKKPGLILDLRGNPGGSGRSLEWMVGAFLNKETKIGDRKGRKQEKPFVAQTVGVDASAPRLVVLLDHASASAAEVFARVIQLERRGIVLGDRSAGLVMEGKVFGYSIGVNPVVYYGALITSSDLIMADGQSLEGKGVVPDELILPSPTDIAERRDPVLARAAEILGLRLSAEEAGRILKKERKK